MTLLERREHIHLSPRGRPWNRGSQIRERENWRCALDSGFGFQVSRLRSISSAMGFLMEFAEHWIRRSMEDPDERDAKFRAHVYKTKEQCDKLKATWASPVKPYGSWNTDKNNAKFLQDLKLSRLPGRNDPYEDLTSAASRSS